MYKLPQMVDEKGPPIKLQNVRSKFRRKEPKARRVSFYKNGEYYDYGIHIPIQGQKHFQSLTQLCDYLTSKTKLTQGVRYIFTEEGKLVKSLDDFENGRIYVVSSDKKFQSVPYGAVSRVKTSHIIKTVALTDDDYKFLKPATPLHKRTIKTAGTKNSLPNASKDNRLITVINNQYQSSKGTILFNMNTPQSFEDVLEDWGQAVGLKNVKRMRTRYGREVRSLSQLKQDFRDVDTFYLEGDDPYRESKTSRKYETGNRIEDETSFPQRKPTLEWIHGYNGSTLGPNLHLVGTGEILYPIGAFAILYNRTEDRQRHYAKHTEEIQSICVHPSLKAVASGQAAGNEDASQAVVHVWNVETLETIIIVGRNQMEGNIIALEFSQDDFMLLTIESGREEAITLWDWESDNIIGRSSVGARKNFAMDKIPHKPGSFYEKILIIARKVTSHWNNMETSGDNITGGAFHPYEDNLMMTFGMHHLAFWKRGKDGFLARRNALSPGHSGRTISSWVFLPDGGFVVGDSSGCITIWYRSTDEQFYIEKEIKAHDNDVNALLLLSGGTLLSGGRSNEDCHLRAWDTEDEFSHVASAKISDFGGIKSMCLQKLTSDDGNVFIGTKYNTILEGSIHRKFRVVVQGHRKDVVDLAVNSDELAFVTVDKDHYIYKWSLRKLYWDERLEIESISVAMYPGGDVVLSGGNNGKFVVLSTENGLVASTVTVGYSGLSVLSYSADGRMLAVGCQEGTIHIYQTQNKGYQYKKVSVLKSENPVLNIDWALDLSALQVVSSDNEFYELTLWNVKNEKRIGADTAENVEWNDHTCTIGHNIIGIWKGISRRKVVYTSCNKSQSGKILVGGDKDGFIRIFRYPCKSSEQVKYYERKQGSTPVTSVRLFHENYLASVGGPAIFIWKLIKQ